MSYRWLHRSLDDPGVVSRLQRALNDLALPLARTLALRGITTFEEVGIPHVEMVRREGD